MNASLVFGGTNRIGRSCDGLATTMSKACGFGNVRSMHLGCGLSGLSPRMVCLGPCGASASDLRIAQKGPFLVPTQGRVFEFYCVCGRRKFCIRPFIGCELSMSQVIPVKCARSGVCARACGGASAFQRLSTNVGVGCGGRG